MNSKVCITKCSDYNLDQMTELIEKSMKILDDFSYFENKKILIKPNMLMPKTPDQAATTHPIFLQAAIRVFKKYTDKIYVGDNPGIHFDKTYKVTGIDKIIEEERVIKANFKEGIEVNVNGKVIKKLKIAKVYKEVDFIVTLPKLKTHAMTKYTGAIKNSYGMLLAKDKHKFHFIYKKHEDFAQLLIDINKFINPNLAIMDAIWAMQGNGPANGEVRETGLILLSKDLTALDATACRIVGILPKDIIHLKKSEENLFGNINEDKIEIIGEKIEDAKVSNFKKATKESDIIDLLPIPRFINAAIGKILVARPRINHSKCILCRECIDVCPAIPNAISLKNKRVVIDNKKCIRCFCCQEMCPEGAIDSGRTLFSRKG